MAHPAARSASRGQGRLDSKPCAASVEPLELAAVESVGRTLSENSEYHSRETSLHVWTKPSLRFGDSTDAVGAVCRRGLLAETGCRWMSAGGAAPKLRCSRRRMRTNFDTLGAELAVGMGVRFNPRRRSKKLNSSSKGTRRLAQSRNRVVDPRLPGTYATENEPYRSVQAGRFVARITNPEPSSPFGAIDYRTLTSSSVSQY